MSNAYQTSNEQCTKYILELTREEIDTLDQLLLIAGRVDSHIIRSAACAFGDRLTKLVNDRSHKQNHLDNDCEK